MNVWYAMVIAEVLLDIGMYLIDITKLLFEFID